MNPSISVIKLWNAGAIPQSTAAKLLGFTDSQLSRLDEEAEW